ncbi:MAG: O-acetylhomoserine aminocarboxypropyltransferase/cysteine synthase [Flavobacteriaceae bacterium]|nr:O-acetylhomoserine aminocarboxypropyltransferase/cysteine synthase [Flavobacteriaceae bacterium]
MNTHQFATQALHQGYQSQDGQSAMAVPIYQTTSYVFKSTEHAANLFGLKELGYIYTRLNNPTNAVLEDRLTALHHAAGSVVTASGTAAIATTLLTLLKSGDTLLSASSLYGGTYNLFDVTLRRFGIQTDFVDASQPENFTHAITPTTKAIFVESLGNPKLDVLDLKKIAQIAHKHHIPLLVDNTIASPALLNPIAYGADIVLYSLTKYIGGNGSSLGGAIVDAGTFNWANGKFPEFTEPSAGYHGLVYWDAFKESSFILKARLEGLRDLGSALSPFNAFQIIQGLETLSLRMVKHSQNALHLATWLQQQPAVAWVNYPGLPNNAYHELAQTYLPKGQSGIITFGLKGGYAAAQKVADHTGLFKLLANVGDSKSLIIHPASTTHQQLSEASQKSTGVTADLIRLSVGLEDVEDLKNDLIQAFQKID